MQGVGGKEFQAEGRALTKALSRRKLEVRPEWVKGSELGRVTGHGKVGGAGVHGP